MGVPAADPRAALIDDWNVCKESFPAFLRHVKIRDTNRGVIPFELWPHTVGVAESWQRGESTIDGKARQQGFSWELAAYDLWTMTFKDYSRILSISMGERESIELLDKVKFIHQELPSHLRRDIEMSNQQVFRLKATQGTMMALPSTENAGRSFQANVVQFDEFAFHPFAGANYDSTRAAIADGGQMIIISTGNGPANMLHDLWEDPDVPFVKRFTNWKSRPDRDEEWYDSEKRAYLTRGNSMFFHRENPGTVDEMFTVFVGLVYGPDETQGWKGFQVHRHMRPEPFTWEDAEIRVAGIDPGQGDPFAILPAGEKDGHLHFFDEFYEQAGGTTFNVALEYLMSWHRRAPFDAIWVDGAEGTLIASLRATGLPAYAASKERGIGISVVRSRLEDDSMTFSPHVDHTRREFQTYRWATRRAPGEANQYTTSTPIDHHGDAMDDVRYCALGISKGFGRSPHGVKPHTANAAKPKPRLIVHHDPGPGRPAGSQRPGPDYRVGRRRTLMLGGRR